MKKINKKSLIRACLGEELVIVILSMDKEVNRKRVSDRHGGLQMWVDTMMVSIKVPKDKTHVKSRALESGSMNQWQMRRRESYWWK